MTVFFASAIRVGLTLLRSSFYTDTDITLTWLLLKNISLSSSFIHIAQLILTFVLSSHNKNYGKVEAYPPVPTKARDFSKRFIRPSASHLQHLIVPLPPI